MNPKTRLHRRPEGFWVTAIILAVLAVSVVLTWLFWDWLRDGESGSSTIRNVGLIIGAVIAMVLAVWRSRVAGRQAATSERGLLNDRFQKGAEMLGSEVLSVRLGGVHTLHHLAMEHPQEYHVKIMYLFCAFARNPTKDDDIVTERVLSGLSFPLLRADVQETIGSLQMLRNADNALEKRVGFIPHLYFANLRGASLKNADLRSANLIGADLSGAFLVNTHLGSALLIDANLSRADFSNQGEKPVTGLTQEQLNQACADPDSPPRLKGVVDAGTGKPLVWRGRPLKDSADVDR